MNKGQWTDKHWMNYGQIMDNQLTNNIGRMEKQHRIYGEYAWTTQWNRDKVKYRQQANNTWTPKNYLKRNKYIAKGNGLTL